MPDTVPGDRASLKGMAGSVLNGFLERRWGAHDPAKRTPDDGQPFPVIRVLPSECSGRFGTDVVRFRADAR
jgi:hypothetical protein